MRIARTTRCPPVTTTSGGMRHITGRIRTDCGFGGSVRSAVGDEYADERPSLPISPDHVHLFLSAHPRHAPTELVRTVTIFTGRAMWERRDPVSEVSDTVRGLWERSPRRGRRATYRPTPLQSILRGDNSCSGATTFTHGVNSRCTRAPLLVLGSIHLYVVRMHRTGATPNPSVSRSRSPQ